MLRIKGPKLKDLSMKHALFKYLSPLLLIFSSAQTAIAADPVSISYDLQVREFNTLASSYLPRPTFINIQEKKKADRLFIRVDFIRPTESKRVSGTMNRIGFSEKRIYEYIAAIDKYLSWEEVARADGDIFEKRIAKILSHKSAYNYFEFHSGNATNHFLSINTPDTSLLALTDVNEFNKKPPDFVFDRENALALKALLTDWKEGKFEKRLDLNVDDKYK